MSSIPSSLTITLPYIQQQLTRYVYALFLIFGVTGCCLNILLLSRRQFRASSCCTYFLTMSVFMLVYIIWISGLYLYALDHIDPNTTILAICKLRIYILQFTGMTYRWCLTAACFDRYALSAFDVRLRNFARVHIARRVVIALISIWLVLPVHGLIFYNIKGISCGILYSSAAALYHSIFTAIAGCILPAVIMITCALRIHRNLILKRQRRQLNVSQQNRSNIRDNNSQNKRDQQVLIMLLIQVLIYIITILPVMSFYFYNVITFNVLNKSLDRLAIERFIFFLAELMIVIFPVSSFYLYTMSSSMFRTELMTMIRGALTCNWSDNIVHIAPIINENQNTTATGHLSRSIPLAPSCYFNPEKLECTIEIDEPQ